MSKSDDILLAQWLSGQISPSDLERLEQTYDLESLKSTLDQQDQYTPEVLDADTLWSQIDTNKKSAMTSPNRKSLILVMIGLLLATLTILLLTKSNTSNIKTEYQSETTKIFADGSEVIISPNTKIDFNEADWKDERIINLEGQAFFKVRKGVPFTVSTISGQIEVLGTQFDVWSINDRYMRVSCLEGKVKVSDKKGQSQIITASQYVYITNGNIGEIENSEGESLDWISNFRNYKTTPIFIVLADMERFYETKLIAESDISKDVFTGILPVNDLNKCIRFIESSLSYESTTSNNKVNFRKAN